MLSPYSMKRDRRESTFSGFSKASEDFRLDTNESGIFISSNYANEISVERINKSCWKNTPENVLLLSQGNVSTPFATGGNISRFKPGIKVSYLPDHKKSVWNNDLNVCSSDQSSCWCIISVEECYLESNTDNSWD